MCVATKRSKLIWKLNYNTNSPCHALSWPLFVAHLLLIGFCCFATSALLVLVLLFVPSSIPDRQTDRQWPQKRLLPSFTRHVAYTPRLPKHLVKVGNANKAIIWLVGKFQLNLQLNSRYRSVICRALNSINNFVKSLKLQSNSTSNVIDIYAIYVWMYVCVSI